MLGKLDSDSQGRIDRAAACVSVAEVIKYLEIGCESETDGHLAQDLVHLKPAGEGVDGVFSGARELDSYCLARTELVSPLAADAVLRRATAHERERLGELLAESLSAPRFARARRALFG